MANITNMNTLRSLNNQSVEVLRNEIIDAVSFIRDAFSFPKEVLQACVKMGIKDYKANRCISHDSLIEQIREKRGWK